MCVFLKVLSVSLFGTYVTSTIPRPSSKTTMSPTLYSLNSTVGVILFDPSRPVGVKIFPVKVLSSPSSLSSPSPTYELFYYAPMQIGWDNIHRFRPTKEPSFNPTTPLPSRSPINPPKLSAKPFRSSASPSICPTIKRLPSSNPLFTSATPSIRQPSIPPSTAIPSCKGPTQRPSKVKAAVTSSSGPTAASSKMTTALPTSRRPTQIPLYKPTALPSSRGPTQMPSKMTTALPTSRRPTSYKPTAMLSTRVPTQTPSKKTTAMPSTRRPTHTPSKKTTAVPSSRRPTHTPTIPSTAAPSQKPTIVPPADDIQYRGGLVYTGDMKIFNIFYGDFSGNGSQSVGLTNYLAANLGTSSWYDILSSYYRIVNGNRVYVQGSLTFAGSYNLFPKWRGNTTTILAIQQNIVRYILNKDIFQPDPNTIFAVIFRGDFRVISSSGLWLKNWCGLHSGFRLVNDANFYPMLMVGDISSVPKQSQRNCSGDAPYPNGNVAADSLASIYAHEVAEVITDPILGQGWTFNPGPGRNPTPWENGDECAWIYPSTGNTQVGTKQYSLQELWQPGGAMNVLSNSIFVFSFLLN